MLIKTKGEMHDRRRTGRRVIMREQYNDDLYILVHRVGIRGEWHGWVETADGTELHSTRRMGGKGAKRRAADECRSWAKAYVRQGGVKP